MRRGLGFARPDAWLVVAFIAFASLVACEEAALLVLSGPEASGSGGSLVSPGQTPDEPVEGSPCAHCGWPAQACAQEDCVPLVSSDRLATSVASTCVITLDRSLWCFGRNLSGELGQADTDGRTLPASVGQNGAFAMISGHTGESFCARGIDRSLYCWGQNGSGQLGVGDTEMRTAPVSVSASNDWAAVFAGSGRSCALSLNHELYCWGRNEDGDLGLGDQTARLEPALLAKPPSDDAREVWVTVALGWGHTCGSSQRGTLYCWGRNDLGQLGVGDNEVRNAPSAIVTPPSSADGAWRQVATGGLTSCALNADAGLYCWGRNDRGQLGLGDQEPRSVPTQVGSRKFRRVSSGVWATCAIDTNAGLWCWGRSIADKDVDWLLPQRVGSAVDWLEVSCGSEHCCGIREGGNLWCWGENQMGSLGQGDTLPRTEPVRVEFGAP